MKLFTILTIIMVSYSASAEPRSSEPTTSRPSHIAFQYLKDRFVDLSRDANALAAVQSPGNIVLVYDSATNTTRAVVGTAGLTIGTIVGKLTRTPIYYVHGNSDVVPSSPGYWMRSDESRGKKVVRRAIKGVGIGIWITGVVLLADAVMTEEGKSSRVVSFFRKVEELFNQIYSSFEIREARAATLTDFYMSADGFSQFLRLDPKHANAVLDAFPKMELFVVAQAKQVRAIEHN